MATNIIKLIWKQSGSINWEEWWVKEKGFTRTKTPSPMDYVSFANFDLEHNRCPKITLKRGQLTIMDVPNDKFGIVKSIIEYHGFIITSVDSENDNS